MERLTNREMAKIDREFLRACKLANQFPSPQRYRRFRHKRGLAYQMWTRHPEVRVLDTQTTDSIVAIGK